MEDRLRRIALLLVEGALVLALVLAFALSSVAASPRGLAWASNVNASTSAQDGLTATSAVFTAEAEPVSMQRMYNPNSGEHFYTASVPERNHLMSVGWRYEGEGWKAPETSSSPVHRLYNPNAGEHHYTMNAGERDSLVKLGWRYEGVGWYSADAEGARLGLYRQYNPNAYACNHNFTLYVAENNMLVAAGWKPEGAAWYGLGMLEGFTDGWIQVDGKWRFYQAGAPARGWLVSTTPPPIGATGGLPQRYWLASDSSLAVGRIVDPSNELDSGSYLSYATPQGFVARGKYGGISGLVYVADNDGRLPDTTGWLVTSQYDGAMQRYYIDSATHAAKADLFTVEGNQYFGMASYGYVARNTTIQASGSWYQADNDGVLTPDAVVNRLVMMAQGYSSSSRYLIMVDIDNPRTIVFEGSRGNWSVKYIWDCCTGAPSTPTKQGVFKVGIKGYSFGENHGYSCYYYTQFSGNYLFHTRKYYPNTHTLLDGRMGVCVSEGCVRLYDENAIWIYNNIPTGTTVVTTK